MRLSTQVLNQDTTMDKIPSETYMLWGPFLDCAKGWRNGRFFLMKIVALNFLLKTLSDRPFTEQQQNKWWRAILLW